MTEPINIDSSRRTHQRKQHVAAFMKVQLQLLQHAVTWSQASMTLSAIYDRAPAMLRC